MRYYAAIYSYKLDSLVPFIPSDQEVALRYYLIFFFRIGSTQVNRMHESTWERNLEWERVWVVQVSLRLNTCLMRTSLRRISIPERYQQLYFYVPLFLISASYTYYYRLPVIGYDALTAQQDLTQDSQPFTRQFQWTLLKIGDSCEQRIKSDMVIRQIRRQTEEGSRQARDDVVLLLTSDSYGTHRSRISC